MQVIVREASVDPDGKRRLLVEMASHPGDEPIHVGRRYKLHLMEPLPEPSPPAPAASGGA